MKKKNVRTMAATAMVGVMTASVGITACAAPQSNQMNGGDRSVAIETGMQNDEMPQGMNQMPDGQKTDNQQAPNGQMPGGQKTDNQQAPEGQMSGGQKIDNQQVPEGQMPNGQRPEGEAPDGINIEGVKEVISKLEDESTKTSIQALLNDFTNALDAEREALDSGSTDEATLLKLKDAVDTAREALADALNMAGIDVESVTLPELPDGETPNGEMNPDEAPNGQMPSTQLEDGQNNKDIQGESEVISGQQGNPSGELDRNFFRQLLDKLMDFLQNAFHN